jgi:hypothetical protein
MESRKKEFLKLKWFSPLKILTFPFYLKETLGAFFLFSFFFNTLEAPSLEDLEVLMILEEKNHFFNNFFSNEMVWTG